jgi:hypothetical protein
MTGFIMAYFRNKATPVVPAVSQRGASCQLAPRWETTSKQQTDFGQRWITKTCHYHMNFLKFQLELNDGIGAFSSDGF